jgi:hypothetical protein
MGPVERAVRACLREGEELYTPGQAKPFWVDRLDGRGLVLLLGKGRWETRIPWDALEGVPDLLRGRGWIRTSGSFAPESDTTTLSGYLKQFVNRETANWVAVVLDKAGVIELDRSRPLSARLSDGF